MSKKRFLLSLVCLVLTGCGGSSNSDDSSGPTKTSPGLPRIRTDVTQFIATNYATYPRLATVALELAGHYQALLDTPVTTTQEAMVYFSESRRLGHCWVIARHLDNAPADRRPNEIWVESLDTMARMRVYAAYTRLRGVQVVGLEPANCPEIGESK